MNKHTIQEWANFIGCDITYSKKSGLGFWYYEIIVMAECHYCELNSFLISDFDLYVNTHGDTGCVKPINTRQLKEYAVPNMETPTNKEQTK